MDFGDDQDYNNNIGRQQRYKEPPSIEETTADEQRLVNRALRPGGVTDGMSEAEKLSFARSLVSKNRREVRERERRKEAAMRIESDSFGYELQALENFRAEKEAREEREKLLAKERRADRAAQRHEEVQARLTALRGGAPPIVRPKGSLPTRMVSRGGTEYELKPVQSSSSSASSSREGAEFETLQSEMNVGGSDYHHVSSHPSSSSSSTKWATSSSSIKSSSSHAQIEAAIAGNRKLSSMTQEKMKGTASFVSKIGKPTASAPAPAPAPAPGPTFTLEGKNADPMMVDRQYVLARPLQLHPWQQPASMRVLKERQREVIEQQERLKEIQKQTQILLEQEQALKVRVEAQKREKAKQEKNALMRKAHVPLAPPSGAAVSPKVVNDHELYPSNSHSVYRSYEDEDIRSPKSVPLYRSPHVSAFKERMGQNDDKDQHRHGYVEEDEDDADAEIAAAEAAILAQKERLLAALGGSPMSSVQSNDGFTTFETTSVSHKHREDNEESNAQNQVIQSTYHPRGIPPTSRLLQPPQQVILQSQQSHFNSMSSAFEKASLPSSADKISTDIDIQGSSTVVSIDPLSPGQRKRQERQRQREIEEARDAAEEAAEHAAQIAREATAAVTAAKHAEEAAKDAERTLLMKMKRLEVEGPHTQAAHVPSQTTLQNGEKKVSKSNKRMNEKLHSDDNDEDNGEGVFIPGLELIGVPLRAPEKVSVHPMRSSTTLSEHSHSLLRQNAIDGDDETFAENYEEKGEGIFDGQEKYGNASVAEDEDDTHYAASKIQAIARGRAARNSVNSMKYLNKQNAVSSNINVDTVIDDEEEGVALEEAVTAEAMYAAKHEAAAIKLQALQRGRAVRSKRQHLMINNDDLIEIVKDGLASVDRELTLEEKVQLEYVESVSNVYETRHEVAAIRLQALQRGRAVRSRFKITKSIGASNTENERGTTHNNAVTENERVTTQPDAEIEVHDTITENEISATDAEEMEEAILSNQMLEAKQRMYEAKHHVAAIKVQALARGRAVRKRAKSHQRSRDQMFDNELSEANETAKVYADKHHAAAIRLQAFQRGRAVRNRMRSSTMLPSDALAGDQNNDERVLVLSDSCKPSNFYSAEHHEAAIKLQALQRGRAVRNELHAGRRQLSFMSSSQIEANFSADGQELVEPSALEGSQIEGTDLGMMMQGVEAMEGQGGGGQVDEGRIDEVLAATMNMNDSVLVNQGRVTDDCANDDARPTVDNRDDKANDEGEGPALMSNDSITGEAPE